MGLSKNYLNKQNINTNNLQAVLHHDFVAKCKVSSAVCKKNKLFFCINVINLYLINKWEFSFYLEFLCSNFAKFQEHFDKIT